MWVWDDQSVASETEMTPVVAMTGSEPVRPNLPAGHPLRDGRTAGSPLIQTALGRPVAHTPVWFMRQAGRSLPEYRELRAGHTMLDTCFDTDLTEITMQPVRRHKVDAAILFSDIVVPMKAVGVDVEIEPGVGPVIGTPFRTAADLDRLPDLDADSVASIVAAVGRLTSELGATPLIGFVGAPFTVASYLVEGRPSRDHVHTKALMLSDPTTWNRLLDRIADICAAFLRMQIMSGASAVQLFDSWAGALSPRDYQRLVLPHSKKVFDSIADLDVPMIHFGVGTGELLGLMEQAGPTVMGIDFRVPLSVAATRFSTPIPLQGNLDPAVLFADPDSIKAAVLRILDDARGLPGHIFNLGHGVPPDTNPEVLTRIVELVHDESFRRFALEQVN